MNNKLLIQKFRLSGLSCPACQKLTEKRLLNIEGVKKVKVNLNGQTELVADKEILRNDITLALKGTDYQLLTED